MINDNNIMNIDIPLNKSILFILRLTVSGAATKAGLNIEAIEDVKTAVDEAIGLFLVQNRYSRLGISIQWNNGISIDISGNGHCDINSGDTKYNEIARCILETLLDDVDIVSDNDGLCSITLKKGLEEGYV